MRTAELLVILFFIGSTFAAEGGNISSVNASSPQNSTWYGVCGQLSASAASPLAINATPGNVSCLTIPAGSCSGSTLSLNILFSNSSSAPLSLAPGSIPALDAFIARENENGTSTFLSNSTFQTGFGAIGNVPTTNTSPGDFRMGYLQDGSGNLVFITETVSDLPGFNGSLFDFQLMLPTQNGTPVTYYVFVDRVCGPAPPGGGGPSPPQGGGGTQTPYWNITNETNVTPPPPPPPPPPNETCTSQVVCGAWGVCTDGYREQACIDTQNCTGRDIFNVEKCPPIEPFIPLPPKNETKPPEEIPAQEPPLCLIPLGLLALLAFLLWRSSWIIYFEAGHLAPAAISFPPALLSELKLKPGDKVSLSYWGKNATALVGEPVPALHEKDSPARASGRFAVMGEKLIRELGLKIDGRRDTKGRGFERFGRAVGLGIKKI
ncbi:MAG: hypothetical protein AB1324_00490 [Candidatus Micrarchaeota archaeon]